MHKAMGHSIRHGKHKVKETWRWGSQEEWTHGHVEPVDKDGHGVNRAGEHICTCGKIYNHGTHIDPGTHTQSQRCVQNRGCPWSQETNTELGTQMESMDVHKPQTYMKLGYTHGTRDHTWN